MAEDNFGMELIPRKIHYCWFGGSSINKKNQKCMESWKKFCGDYEIVCWDESNCDIRKNKYVFEAYKNKKWAFVSDYFRLEALYNFGGIYLDTDVELTKPLDAFLDYSGFIGFEDNENIATCVIGGKKGHIFFDKALSVYENRCFLTEDGKLDTTTNVKILTEMLIENGLITDGQRQQVLNMEIFPSDFFSPKSLATGKITMTENTCAIHLFNATWQTSSQRVHTKISQIIGQRNTDRLKKIIGKNKSGSE